jgi:uncharacterized protein (UPF0276 family)
MKEPIPGTPEYENLFKKVPIPPEILEWAQNNINEEEILAEMREIQETGGLKFSDFEKELEALITTPE